MDASELVKNMNIASNMPAGAFPEEKRAELLAVCETLKRSVESPLDTTKRLMFSTYDATAVRLAIDTKLFDAAMAAGGPSKVDQLAAKTSADPLLVARIMRHLAAMGMFRETEKNTFVPNPIAGAYVRESPLASAIIHITHIGAVMTNVPDYFMHKGYVNPQDAFDGPFQHAMGTKLHYFDWLKENPYYQNAFHVVMGIQRTGTGEEWFEFYPVEKRLGQKSPQETLLVDIGGGLGHDLIAFKAKYPQLSGKLIIQELPAVVDAIKDLPNGIEAMRYDFLAPQPVKGAKAYYLRTILHDWPDKQARQILANIKDAMTDDSLLLVNETVLPEADVSLYESQLDLNMMGAFSSLERTLAQFEALLDSAGFEIIHAYKPKTMIPGCGLLLEAKVKA